MAPLLPPFFPICTFSKHSARVVHFHERSEFWDKFERASSACGSASASMRCNYLHNLVCGVDGPDHAVVDADATPKGLAGGNEPRRVFVQQPQ
jgi:hypothetical protein